MVIKSVDQTSTGSRIGNSLLIESVNPFWNLELFKEYIFAYNPKTKKVKKQKKDSINKLVIE